MRALLVLGLVASAAGPARAHAPLSRAVAVAPDGSGALVVRMPGFGFLVRSARDARFAYACDALYGVSPLEELTPLAYRADGTLLVGTQSGLRVVEPSGCPSAQVRMAGAAIVALAVHGSGRIYAITQTIDAPPVLQRSDDGGETWTAGGALTPLPVTALVLDASDEEVVYVSQSSPPGAQLSASSDGGASFTTIEASEPLILLHAQASPARLWARMRIAGQPVGVSIAHAATLDGPWSSALEVNFFGGFASDPSDSRVIFVGDEARGVFRSDNGGESFDETQPDVASASLTYGDGALWSCTPGLPSDTALARSSDAVEAFEPVMAFDDVEQLVECEGVEEVCAAAWVEWQRDVLLVSQPPVDAGSSDAGSMDAPDASDAGMQVDAALAPDPEPRASSGCALAVPRSTRMPALFFVLLFALCRRLSGSAYRSGGPSSRE